MWALWSACQGQETATTAVELPSLSFLAPTDGSVVAVGPLDVSLVVEHFQLEAPAQTTLWPLWTAFIATASAHDETGIVSGYVALELDGTVVEPFLDATQATVDVGEAGPHTLTATLFYVDGDAVEPPAVATVSFDAE